MVSGHPVFNKKSDMEAVKTGSRSAGRSFTEQTSNCHNSIYLANYIRDENEHRSMPTIVEIFATVHVITLTTRRVFIKI